MTDDKIMVEAILNGDTDSFKLLVERYQRLVSHVVGRMVNGIDDREDVCQEVFLRVYRSLSGFRFNARLSTWISRIAYNAALNYLERNVDSVNSLVSGEFLQSAVAAGPDPERSVTATDLCRRLHAAVDELPTMQGLVVTLYHLEDFSYEEIADILSMPIGTVKSHLFRARRLLRENLLTKYSKEEIWD
jgi:RNA polymerase sigma-70 factor (ECF subfamily)